MLKLSCHLLFLHAFSELRSDFLLLTMIEQNGSAICFDHFQKIVETYCVFKLKENIILKLQYFQNWSFFINNITIQGIIQNKNQKYYLNIQIFKIFFHYFINFTISTILQFQFFDYMSVSRAKPRYVIGKRNAIRKMRLSRVTTSHFRIRKMHGFWRS